MKIVRGIKIGGLQQKIFNLMLIFIVALAGAYAAVSAYQHKNLTAIVQETSAEQQASIAAVSEETMEAVLGTSMTQSTALQAYIADELFADVRADVLTLQAFAEELIEHADSFSSPSVNAPSATNEGKPAAMLIYEEGADPENSEALGLVANMSEIMLAMFEASDELSSIFVGTADGNMVLVNDRSSIYVAPDGTPLPLDIRSRPWYKQAAEAGELIFTGVELDAFTETPMLECAAPVYHDGELVAVVGADIYLTSISDYVASKASEGNFICVVNEHGQMLFSPEKEGIFRVELSANAPDLRENENGQLAALVTRALRENTGLELVEVDGKEYFMSGAPLGTVGWTVLSVVDKELTRQPTELMLEQYEQINADALVVYEQGARRSTQRGVVLIVGIVLMAIAGALKLGMRIVRPLEQLTKRINAQRDGDDVFVMDDAYRTDDEIQILAEAFSALTKRTQDYIGEIISITAEKKRIGTELALATRIQADMLPNIFPAFPERPDFDIYAIMDPAKEVGGDFYDFFLIDETHLAMVMADVSGKGVPAALFMMISKILVQNYAMTGRTPAQVLQSVNDQICANNREEMFVTVWLGILDTETGRVTAANAGHEYPVVMQTAGRFELVKDKHGFVIGGMEGIRYREYELNLTPGSRVFLYTDGVPEATDTNNNMFGTERMLDALNEVRDESPEMILKHVRKAVDSFVGNAEQFDDLTMLCLEYMGTEKMGMTYEELELPAEVDRLPELISFLEQKLEGAGCPMKARMQISVAAEEIFVNIASYAYDPGQGTARVRLAFTENPMAATVTFIDSGLPFNPLEKADPDVSLSAEERQIGGLGIYLTKKTMDDVRYAYKDGQNILTLTKNF